ncbi:MAG: hypothetical protein B0D92_06910 [Spirochaeta sp. LUC14_002_19_P3]|nr:MAG: hypothetical protein B0D92_06910 [Spirochaeta sp. LUC14_002_19_P3]
MVFFFIAGFFLAVRGAERTVVPEITDLTLVEALIMLQERELYPRLQVKYTGNPGDRGRIIAQNPEPGLYVKAGRRITITVSKGAIIDNVEDYTGKTVEEVRSRLRTLFSTYEPLLIIREPITFVYNDAPAGTILSQVPAPGSPLAEPRELILIVSRSKTNRPIKLPDWTNLSSEKTLKSLSTLPVTFEFTQSDTIPSGTIVQVISQSPLPGSIIEPGSMVSLRYKAPASLPKDIRHGLYSHILPEYPVPVLLEAIVRQTETDDYTLFSMPYPGGPISFPYTLPAGSSIVLKVNGKEVNRMNVLP